MAVGRGENHGRDRSGATSAWCGLCGVPEGVRGCSRERSGTPPGAFRGAFACENLPSEQKDSFTLSTNAVVERIFSRGRRMWPLARKSADPVEACGAVLKQYLVSNTLLAIYG